MKKIDPIKYSDEIVKALGSGGMFLTSKLGSEINTMTMGWGSMSYYWVRPVFIAPVRTTRHSHHMIKESGVFTVSVPYEGKHKGELGICGTKSGRDVDKFKACGLSALDGKKVDCPVIADTYIQLECKVVAETLLDDNAMNSEIVDKHYGSKNFHTLFFGEIVAAYILE